MQLREWLRAFVVVKADSHALVSDAGHHAGSGEQRVVDRVRRDIGVSLAETHADDHQVVDVFEILADHLFGHGRSDL